MADLAASAASNEPGQASVGEANRDRLSIQRLVQMYYQDAYRYAYRLTGNDADASDICQQTFLTAQRKLDQVRDVEKVDRWLLSIVRTSFLKSRRRKQPLTGIDLPVDAVPDRCLNQIVDRELIQLALDELPDEFRIVVTMFYFEDQSYKDIAAALEIPIGTIMSRLSRAKGRMRARLYGDRLHTEERLQPGGDGERKPGPAIQNKSMKESQHG